MVFFFTNIHVTLPKLLLIYIFYFCLYHLRLDVPDCTAQHYWEDHSQNLQTIKKYWNSHNYEECVFKWKMITERYNIYLNLKFTSTYFLSSLTKTTAIPIATPATMRMFCSNQALALSKQPCTNEKNPQNWALQLYNI